jgi:hypothetical protein
VIRLFTSDGMSTPEPLIDCDDGDWEILLDVTDGDAVDDLRADGSPASWLLDGETLAFLAWNGMSPATVNALRSRMRPDGLVELSWEEMSA